MGSTSATLEPTATATATAGPRRQVWALIGIAAATALLVQWPSLSKGFVFDDYHWIRLVMSPEVGPGVAPTDAIFRPGLLGWFAGLHAVFGLNPLPYHLAGWVLLVVAAVEVGLIAHRIGLGRQQAIAATFLTAAHPAWTPAVEWVSAASSLLAVALGLGAVLLSLHDRMSGWSVAATVLLTGTALLTRESAVVLAVAVPTMVAVSYGRDQIARRSLPVVAVVGVHVAVRMAAGATDDTGPYALGLGAHIFENVAQLLGDAWMLPGDLVWYGGRAAYGAAVGGLAVLLAMAVRDRAQSGTMVPAAGGVWFLAGLAPTMLFLNHAMEPYYLDFALPGLALALAALWRPARWWPAAAAVVVVAFGAATFESARSPLTEYRQINADQLAQVDQRYPDGPDGRIVVDGCAREETIARHGDLFRVVYDAPDLDVVWRCPGG